jgi:hypothetical protein
MRWRPFAAERDNSLVSTDLVVLSAAYWRYQQLSQGSRQERLASEEFFWAWDAVSTATWESPEEPLEMIDAIPSSPDAALAEQPLHHPVGKPRPTRNPRVGPGGGRHLLRVTFS